MFLKRGIEISIAKTRFDWLRKLAMSFEVNGKISGFLLKAYK